MGYQTLKKAMQIRLASLMFQFWKSENALPSSIANFCGVHQLCMQSNFGKHNWLVNVALVDSLLNTS